MTAALSSILIVDDEESISQLLLRALSDKYACSTAGNAEDAIRMLEAQSYELVLADITMPGTSGLELCAHVSRTCSDTVVVMVSGMNDIQSAIEAMRFGAFDYVVKPFDLSHVSVTVERALRHQALLAFKQHYERSLEETVRARTHELRLVNEDLNDMLEVLYSNYRTTLRALAKALEARDAETHGHSERVVAYCLTLARQLGLRQRDLIAVEQGALLHDIGKIGVRDSILLKAGPLTEDQWIEMRAHIDHGLAIIEGIDFLTGAGPIVGQHHEKFDGTGYPQGLSGDAIHLHARIFAVADAYDAITSDRPYRAGRPHSDACDEIIASAGTHFDPLVVDAFLKIPEALLSEMRREAASQSYAEQMIEKDEIRSFILSLKHAAASRMPVAAASFNAS
jgi:response regulator RpfG family c-di-GMP phosphodiesterase